MNDLQKIIAGDYCIGCGACAATTANIKIIEDKYKKYQANIINDLDDKQLTLALNVCPFSNNGQNEDEISKTIFNHTEGRIGEVIGFYRSLYAGHVVDDNLRMNSTSGGIITWILMQLLETSLIDAVIHIKKSSKKGTLFEYGISKTKEEIMEGAKSRYYPIEMSKVLEYVKKNDLRYAFVGLPCFVKAIRKSCVEDKILADRIQFCVGLVCGHLKSKAYSEYVAWQAGITPENLAEIDFRYKVANQPANNYGIFVKDIYGNNTILNTRSTLGTNWGLGYFKYEACDYCDDIFAETADINVGDAWLKHYTVDYKGNSVIITRNKQIDEIIKNGIESGALKLDILSEEEIRQSQGGGFRHRRSGLEYRLYLKQRKGEWAPKKRVPINKNGISLSRKIIYIFRVYLQKKSSHYWMLASKNGNYDSFERRMRIPGRIYQLFLNLIAWSRKSN